MSHEKESAGLAELQRRAVQVTRKWDGATLADTAGFLNDLLGELGDAGALPETYLVYSEDTNATA